MGWNFIFLVLSLCICLCISICPCVDGLNNYTSHSMDAFLQDFAFKALVRHRPHTGALYKAVLPANLSGMEASIVRIRSRTLWNIGANFSYFNIPSRTIPVPHARRLAIVYQDLGNWSSQFYSVPDYSMITSVVGFMVFDASNVGAKSITKLSLNTTGNPIVIRFSSLTSPRVNSKARCVAFSNNGTIFFSQLSLNNVCHTQDQGHFAIVVPLEGKEESQGKRKRWYFWVIGFVLGFGGLVLVGYIMTWAMKILMSKKIQVMERQADEDLVLETLWVGRSKMPSATVTRTQPTLESGGFP